MNSADAPLCHPLLYSLVGLEMKICYAYTLSVCLSIISALPVLSAMDVLGERTRGRERDPGSVNSMNDEADSGGNGLKVEHLRCVQ